MCLAQGPQPSDAGEAQIRGPRSRVMHSTTEPLRSLFLFRLKFSLIHEYMHTQRISLVHSLIF